MKEKTPQEQTAAARQVELLTKALEGAAADGHWLNLRGRMAPRIHGHAGTVSPFNALMFTLHADTKGYSTAVYTSFTDARKRGEAVLKEERSVPMNWYRWANYVNRHDEKDVISREQYQPLPPEQQNLYKAVRQREIRSLFNVEQTTMPMVDAKGFESLLQRYGTANDRGNIQSEERQLRSAVSQFRSQISENLAPIRKATTGVASYDNAKNAIYMPDQKHFGHYNDYVQELVRQAVSATGHSQRLAREGMVMNGGKVPSEQALRYEQLVGELASAVKMTELGLPAKLKPESLPLVEYWTQELRENPCLIDAIEGDVNNALDVLRKAEHGEKLEFATDRTRQETQELREQREGRPQVSSSEALILQDIIRKGGMEINVLNFPGGQEEKNAFMAKFTNLDYYESQVNAALWQAQDRLPKVEKDPEERNELINVAYTAATNEGARIYQHSSEWMPKDWEEKGSRFIADELDSIPDKRSKEFVVVMDKTTGIADVILPATARSGGDVLMPNGDRRNYWLTPDEVMLAEERKEASARVVPHSAPGFSKPKITEALMAQGASYVRFYNKEGALQYHPDDTYFANKEAYSAKLSGNTLNVVSRFDLTDAVKRSTEKQFERIQMLRDDDGKWALYLKPEGEASFAIHPDRNDVNRFFAVIKQGNQEATSAVRNELAQKYYALAQNRPELQVNIFGTVPEGIDLRQIQRVNIFRSKDEQILLLPVIEGKEKIKPRPITNQQWQRLWIADDMQAYKTTLAAQVFADMLQQKAEEVTVDQQKTEEKAEVQPDVANNFPNLQQYDDLKAKHPEAILLFRVDDSYEAYKEDSLAVAKVLKLKTEEVKHPTEDLMVDVARFPKGELDTYLPKLVRSGARVAICEAMEPMEKQGQRVERSTAPEAPKEVAQEEQAHRGIRM